MQSDIDGLCGPGADPIFSKVKKMQLYDGTTKDMQI